VSEAWSAPPRGRVGSPGLSLPADRVKGLLCRHIATVNAAVNAGIAMRGAKRAQMSSQITDAARQHIETKINVSHILPVSRSLLHCSAQLCYCKQCNAVLRPNWMATSHAHG
jgi:hypothetical protein